VAIRKISLQEAEYVAHRLAVELMPFNEPIPPFSTRFPGKLESCLEQPFQTFDNKSLYYFFIQKAAILFYLVVKNHPFNNGNKRMAVTLFSFIRTNTGSMYLH
jgi:prophage maintenance system killer protein